LGFWWFSAVVDRWLGFWWFSAVVVVFRSSWAASHVLLEMDKAFTLFSFHSRMALRRSSGRRPDYGVKGETAIDFSSVAAGYSQCS
jgi:hypothetical protein